MRPGLAAVLKVVIAVAGPVLAIIVAVLLVRYGWEQYTLDDAERCGSKLDWHMSAGHHGPAWGHTDGETVIVFRFAVGAPVARRPPHRSGRAR